LPLGETIGYAFRAAGLRQDLPNPSTYISSSTFIIIAPAFIAATLYQLLAHIIIANGRAGSRLSVKLGLGLGFGALDVLSYALQAAGKLSSSFTMRSSKSNLTPCCIFLHYAHLEKHVDLPTNLSLFQAQQNSNMVLLSTPTPLSSKYSLKHAPISSPATSSTS
jgi:RTA1 like protein